MVAIPTAQVVRTEVRHVSGPRMPRNNLPQHPRCEPSLLAREICTESPSKATCTPRSHLAVPLGTWRHVDRLPLCVGGRPSIPVR